MNKIDSARSKWQRFPRPHLAIASAIALGVTFALLKAPVETDIQTSANSKHTYTLTIDGNTANDSDKNTVDEASSPSAKLTKALQKEQALSHSTANATVVNHNLDQRTPTNSSFTEGDDLPNTIDLTKTNSNTTNHMLNVSTVSAIDATQRTLAKQPQPPKGHTLAHTVRKGESLSSIFKKLGFSSKTLHKIVNSCNEAKQLANIKPGQQLEFLATPLGDLTQIT